MGNDCLMSIDGTDFRITQKGPAFASHKYAGKSALCYELGIDILVGNLVWVGGPYAAGKWNDMKIFLNELAHCLKLARGWRLTMAMWGMRTKLNVPTMTATWRKTSRCRLTLGHATRPSTLVSNFGGFSDKSTATTL